MVFPDRWNVATLRKHFKTHDISEQREEELLDKYVVIEEKLGEIKGIKELRRNKARSNIGEPWHVIFAIFFCQFYAPVVYPHQASYILLKILATALVLYHSVIITGNKL